MFFVKKVIPFALFAIVLLAGCTSDTEYVSPQKVETDPGTESGSSDMPAAVEKPVVTIFEIGDTATDGELEITVKAVRFVSEIDEQDNQFLIATAPTEKQYAVVDILVENILSDETQSVSTMLQTSVVDEEGYTYEMDFEGFLALDGAFSDGEVLPSMKKRGELAYLVSSESQDLKFIYRFDLFTGTSAVFDIK